MEPVDKLLKVLIVDDEVSQRTGLAGMVNAWGMSADTASEGGEALEKVASFSPDVIVTDLNMPGMDGYQFLEKLQEMGADAPPSIVLTAFGSIETGVRTVHELGAFWFLEKPVQSNVLQMLLRRAATHNSLRTTNRILERQLLYKGSLGEMVGTSGRMQEIFVLLQQAGPTNACVLISGESGTGKELVARTLHALSPRRQGRFFAINCAALPETLIESELFGHEKGSFTDATARRVGQFELANSGTLFLDEIGDLSPMTQAKLLRVLQEREFTRIGGVQAIKVDVRIVAATNKNLEELVRKGQFREDLYYRINVIALYLPPLRDRGEDIPLLAKHFLSKRIEEENRPNQEFSKDSLELLARYPWPGNVREMENIIEQAFIWSKGSDAVTSEHLPNILKNDSRSSSLRDDTLAGRLSLEKAVMEFEREIILDALKRTNYIQTHAANLLGISRRMLKYRMDTLGIGRPDQEVSTESPTVVQE